MEFGNRQLVPTAVLAGFVLSAAACAAPAPLADRVNLTPVQRYEYDFIRNGLNTPLQNCLSETPYEAASSNLQEAATFVYSPETDVLTVTPTNGAALEVTGFDQQGQYLAPLHEDDAAILDTYGCQYGPAQ